MEDAQEPTRTAREDKILPQILFVDDDIQLCRSLQRLLRMDGFEVTAVHTASEGVRAALGERQYDLVILDVMLAGGDGRLALKTIRSASDVPVIMLTARGDDQDRIAGLEAGADDYLPKPFNPRELVARMRAVLKRRRNAPSERQRLAAGDLELHLATRRVLQSGREVSLTGTEFEILVLLMKSAGHIVSREDIASICLGRPVGPFDRSVDNHICNLRKKLGAQYQDLERIRSLRGAGYVYTGRLESS